MGKNFLTGIFLAVVALTSVLNAQVPQPPKPGSHEKLQKASEVYQSLLSFRDQRTSAFFQAQVADLSWKYYETFARTVFRFALTLLEPDEKDKARDTYEKTAQRRKVITLIGRHDAKWAKTLLDSPKEKKTGDFPDGFAETETARELLSSDEEAAIDIANNAAITPSIVSFLKQLRLQNPQQANALFLSTLARFSSQPNGKGDLLALLGTYIFTSPNIAGDDIQTMAITRVGNIGMPNIYANRPGTTANLVAPYLRSVITLLSRPSGDAEERVKRYALGYLTVPKAQEFAPNLTGELMAAMSALSTNVDPQYTNSSAYKYIGATPGPPEGRMKEIEENPDEAARDLLYLDVAFHAYRRKDFSTARTAYDKIKNAEITGPLDILLDFGEISLDLDKKNIDLFDVDKRISKLKESPEKALLWLRLATAASVAKNVVIEVESLSSARQTAERLAGSPGPYMLSYISGRMKERGDAGSHFAFYDAVKMFNRTETAGEPVFQRTVGIAPLILRAQLEIKDVNLDFQASVRKLYAGDEENGLLAVADLKDEKLKGTAYVALLRSILDRKSVTPSPSKPKD